MKVSEEFEKNLVEYQQLEKQLQSILLQRHQLQLQLNEINMALEELKRSKGDVFKSVGSILVKTTASDAERDLKEKKEISEIRLGTLSKQEEKLKTNLLNLQKKLEEGMKQYEGKPQM